MKTIKSAESLKRTRVVLGMSGGVDSSVAAVLLKEAGYEVLGVSLILSGYETIESARQASEVLQIPFHVLDRRELFEEEVIRDFSESYLKGITPNPCARCNPRVKWRALLDYADEQGAYYIATGHYAKIRDGQIYQVTDKDQTYALYGLKPEQVERALMPLGGMTKESIREIARNHGILAADHPDSMEICFIPDHDYAGYIQRREPGIDIPAGDFVDESGKVLGKHKGIIHYTVGQRKGLGIALGEPMYVTRIDPESNEVCLGTDAQTLENVVYADDVNLFGELPETALGKIRYNHKGSVCHPEMEGNLLKCTFEDPVRAVTPGQALVLYQDGRLLGGGKIIKKTVKKLAK